MKHLILAAFMAATVNTVQAQHAVPEFKNKVMTVSKADVLDNLETTTLSYNVKSGMGNGSVSLATEGKNAGVTFDPASGTQFIVKIDAETDPETVVNLYRFTVGKKDRKIVTGKVGMTGMKDIDMPTVKLGFKKVQDGVYIISTRQPLEEGEYIFTVSQPLNVSVVADVKGFAFSVPKS